MAATVVRLSSFRETRRTRGGAAPLSAVLEPYVPELDGLRGVAIALVIAYHALPWSPTQKLVEKVVYRATSLGWAGVDLFFVLSGFLITGILLDGGARQLPTFYARRALRIFPAFYTLLGVLLLVHYMGLTRGYPDLASLFLASATYFSNVWLCLVPGNFPVWAPLGVTWSLAVEEQFYLVWPWVVRALGRGLGRLSVGIFLVVTLCRVLLVLSGNQHLALEQYLTPLKLDALGAGAFLAVVVRSPGLTVGRFRRSLAWASAAVLPTTALLVAGNGLAWGSASLRTVGYPLLAVSFTCVLAWALIAPETALGAMLRTRPLVGLGRISYGVYLWHQVPNWIFEDHLLRSGTLERWGLAGTLAGGLLRFGVVFAATVALAVLSWRLVETPMLRFKQRFVPARGAPETVPAARQALRA